MSGGHLKLFAELKLRQVTLLLFVELCLFLSQQLRIRICCFCISLVTQGALSREMFHRFPC